MNEKRKFTPNERKLLWRYLIYTFGIAWGTELLLILAYGLGLLRGSVATVVHFAVIGFGAGMAPAYGAFLAKRREMPLTLKEFCKRMVRVDDRRRAAEVLVVLGLIQLGACVVQESYRGYPWYLFILFMPMMILGGGLEEVGWRGVFQPLLEKRFTFLISALIEGVIWSIWHLPLWFVPNTSQGSYDFLAFTLYCITLGLTLAAAYRLTNCIWVTVLLHAWGNTVLGGMYTLTSLENFPGVRTLIVYLIQVFLIMGYYKLRGKKNN